MTTFDGIQFGGTQSAGVPTSLSCRRTELLLRPESRSGCRRHFSSGPTEFIIIRRGLDLFF